MEKRKFGSFKKAILILCFATAVISAMVFIPQIRELIMILGDSAAGKSINRELWSFRLIFWEIQFLCILTFIVLFLIFENRPNQFAKNDALIKTDIVSWLLVAVSSVALIALAFQSNDVWLDETFSLGLARHSVKELILLTAQDVHPPLYYLILKAGLIFNPNSVALAKIVSVIPVIIILCVSNVFFKKEFSSLYAITFNLILMCTSAVFHYAIEIRMYSWAMLFCMLCCIFSYYIIKKNSFRYFLFYVIFAVCGAYCQYWTAVALALNFVMTSILSFAKYKKIKNILITAAIGIVLYLPWASVVIKQVSTVTENYWIGPITLKTFANFMFEAIPLSGFRKIIAIFFLGLFFIKTVKAIINKDENSFFPLICLLTPFLLIICATIISLATRPIFYSRYVVPTIVFTIFYITISLHSDSFQNKELCFIFLLGVSMFSIKIVEIFKNERKCSEAYQKFTKTMKENLSDDTVFMFSQNINSHIPGCIAYFFPKNRICGYSISEMWTNAIFYSQNNLIETYDGETDICLILNAEENPPSEFSDTECHLLTISQYPANKFCFYKGQ